MTAARKGQRAVIYARVSTADQTTANQLDDLRTYVTARGWTLAHEYRDEAVSGTRERRPALDQLVQAAQRRRFDVLVVWRLDRLGRSLRHLITLIDELQALGIAFVSLAEGIDATTPAGRLQLHVLAAIAQFERDRIAERVRAGLARARREGKRLGRPRRRISEAQLASIRGLSQREAAKRLGVARSTLRRRLVQKPMRAVGQKRQ